MTTVGALSVGGGPAAASAGDGNFRLTDPRITESSGLAASRAHRHTVWTVNDSGDSARVFAVDTRTGDTVGVHTFDAPVQDVEALAIGPDGRMFVGDIGDNDESRPLVRVFWFDEPPLGQTRGRWASWEFAYPDGPHDAEALLVDPRSGRLSIVTKDEPGAVYAAPDRPSRSGVNRLTRVATAPPVVTDGVVLADGRVALRGYLRLGLYAADTWELLSERPCRSSRRGRPSPQRPGARASSWAARGWGRSSSACRCPCRPGRRQRAATGRRRRRPPTPPTPPPRRPRRPLPQPRRRAPARCVPRCPRPAAAPAPVSSRSWWPRLWRPPLGVLPGGDAAGEACTAHLPDGLSIWEQGPVVT